MELGELMKIRGVLFKHKDDAAEGVSFGTKYKITKFLFNTDTEASFCDQSIKEIDAQYQEKDHEYIAKVEELLKTEVDKSIQFTMEELEYFSLSVEDLICLYSCITEEES